MARRWRRSRRGKTLSGKMRQYLTGFLFLGLSAFIPGIAGYVSSQIPATNITFGDVNISNTIFLNILGFAVGIVLFLAALRKLDVRL